MIKTAKLDVTTCFRYRLRREWDASLPALAWVMLNPSTADHEQDDPTIRRCIKFAQTWGGYGAIEVVNLFAFRSPSPAEMKRVIDPVGSDNDAAIRACAQEAGLVIAAWGNHGSFKGRDREVMAILGEHCTAWCLGTTQSGAPKHPLARGKEFVPYGAELHRFRLAVLT